MKKGLKLRYPKYSTTKRIFTTTAKDPLLVYTMHHKITNAFTQDL